MANKKLMIGLGIAAVLLAGLLLLGKEKQKTKEGLPQAEEILVQEEGMVKKSGGETKIMSEEEIAKMKEEVESVLAAGGLSVTLKDTAGGSATGLAKRAFSDGRFYYKLTASGLMLLDKGYYYESWLKKGDDYLSTGRLEVDAEGNASLYYTASDDRSDYLKVLVTMEPEDGNPAPAKAVLEGDF